jgi:hypothetical protein
MAVDATMTGWLPLEEQMSEEARVAAGERPQRPTREEIEEQVLRKHAEAHKGSEKAVMSAQQLKLSADAAETSLQRRWNAWITRVANAQREFDARDGAQTETEMTEPNRKKQRVNPGGGGNGARGSHFPRQSEERSVHGRNSRSRSPTSESRRMVQQKETGFAPPTWSAIPKKAARRLKKVERGFALLANERVEKKKAKKKRRKRYDTSSDEDDAEGDFMGSRRHRGGSHRKWTALERAIDNTPSDPLGAHTMDFLEYVPLSSKISQGRRPRATWSEKAHGLGAKAWPTDRMA